MMHFFYNIAIQLLFLALWLKSFFDDTTKEWNLNRKSHFNNLDSIKLKAGSRRIIWMHCASLGEYEQGIPVLRSLKNNYPDYFFLLSFFSPSGYNQRKNSLEADEIIYLPIDTPSNAHKIVSVLKPYLFIGVKYEFWWNLLKILQSTKTKIIYLAVFIEKEKYYLKYNFFKNILQKIDYVFTQDKSSHVLLRSYGLNNTFCSLDTRIKSVVERKERQNLLKPHKLISGVRKPVIVYGSIYESDMNVIIPLLSEAEYVHILVPHKVDKSHLSKIEKLIPSHYTIWSEMYKPVDKPGIILVDVIGVLFDLYRNADFAYIGGGFEKNVHNTLEPAVFGLPIAFGPKNEGFLEVKDFINLDVAKAVYNSEDLKSFVDLKLQAVEVENNKAILSRYFHDKEKYYAELIETILPLLNS